MLSRRYKFGGKVAHAGKNRVLAMPEQEPAVEDEEVEPELPVFAQPEERHVRCVEPCRPVDPLYALSFSLQSKPKAPPSILNRIFDHIYVVNMPSRTDRLALSQFKLEQHGISAEIWPAVVGKLPRYDALAQTMLKIPKTFITTRGAVGLMLTWQAMVRR